MHFIWEYFFLNAMTYAKMKQVTKDVTRHANHEIFK